jgi:hypothetical protein
MLTFLRKIRKSLINSGSARRYFLYAIGEIALVVIGILIALQINNWNEDRKKGNLLKNHLESLARAVDHDIRELSISLEFEEFRYHSWQYLLAMSGIHFDSLKNMPRPNNYIEDEVWEGTYPDTLNKELIDRALRQLDNAFLGFVFNKSAINEINNLGLLSDMKEDTLKVLINDYYYYLDWKFGEHGVNKRYKLAEDMKIYFRDEFAISINYPPAPQKIIDAIKIDEKLVIMIKDLINEANDHYWGTHEIQERAFKLVGVLRNGKQNH